MNSTTAKVLAAATLSLSAAHVAQAATPDVGQSFTINSVADSYGTWVSGSYFGMDQNNKKAIEDGEKTALASGTEGLVYGFVTEPGASHGGTEADDPGIQYPGDTNRITAPWGFFGNTGSDFMVTPSKCLDAACTELDFSGWRVTWNGIPEINMSSGAWVTAAEASAGVSFSNGVAKFSWDGTPGGAYTIVYRATVPVGDPSGFGGVKYELYLEGNAGAVLPVPEAETYAMMLAGLGLVGAMVSRRRKTLA